MSFSVNTFYFYNTTLQQIDALYAAIPTSHKIDALMSDHEILMDPLASFLSFK